jgi:hypothetical protein
MTRTKSIKIRLTDEEYRRLKSIAGAHGVSALLRIRALGPDQRQAQNEKLIMLAEMARVRNVLSQIAQSSARVPWEEQIQIVAQLISVERTLTRLKP